jgi:hypothetical protein
MKSNTAIKFVPVFSDDKKVELMLNGDQTEIKLSTWTEGIGWCGQKTMSLDADLLDEMHRLIVAARTRIRNKKTENSLPTESKTILQFPNVA